jgi:hypothetical protein
MTNFVISVVLAMTFGLAQAAQTQKPHEAGVAAMTLKGCLRAHADPSDPGNKRMIYTLEIPDEARDRAAAGTSGRSQAAPETAKKVELSTTTTTADTIALSKHVGQGVEVTGELLQPPGLPPAAAKTTPLPSNRVETFRVSTVKMLAPKCE